MNTSCDRRACADHCEEAVTTQTTILALSLASVIFIAVFAVLAVRTKARRSAAAKLLKSTHLRQEQRVKDALETVKSLTFPCVLLSLRDFLELGGLRSYEETRKKHEHVDTMHDLAFTQSVRIVFFSHQWTSVDQPDHTGRQYSVMCAALRRIVSEELWVEEDVRVWVDYSSTPQLNKHTQRLAVRTFVSYAACAHAFVIVAPPILHRDTGKLCNVHTYNGRMWCRAEQLSHYMRNGADNMWLAVSEDRLVKEMDTDDSVHGRSPTTAVASPAAADVDAGGEPTSCPCPSHLEVRASKLRFADAEPPSAEPPPAEPPAEPACAGSVLARCSAASCEGSTSTARITSTLMSTLISAPAGRTETTRSSSTSPPKATPCKRVGERGGFRALPAGAAVSAANAFSSTAAGRKSSVSDVMIDTTGDGVVDSVAMDSTGDGELDTVRSLDDLVAAARIDSDAFLRVFQGEATVETDKLDLVLPLLGLYGELLAMRHNPDLSPKHHQRIVKCLDEIERNRDEIFPVDLRIVAGSLVRRGGRNPRDNNGRLRRSLDKNDAQFGGSVRRLTSDTTYELFGDLAERVGMIMEDSSALRIGMARQITRLRRSPRFSNTSHCRRPSAEAGAEDDAQRHHWRFLRVHSGGVMALRKRGPKSPTRLPTLSTEANLTRESNSPFRRRLPKLHVSRRGSSMDDVQAVSVKVDANVDVGAPHPARASSSQ